MNKFNDSLFDISSRELYPSAGAGILRYTLQTEQKVSFRVDYAIGESGNDGLYVSVREAF